MRMTRAIPSRPYLPATLCNIMLLFALAAPSTYAAQYVTHINPVPDATMGVPYYDAAAPLDAAYTDEQFGTTVVRITGNRGDSILLNGTTDSGKVWNRHTCHQYSSTDTAWNVDGSLLVLDGCDNREGYLLDGNTFKVLRTTLNSIYGVRIWSRTDKEKMFAIGSNSVVWYYPRTDQAEIKWTFSGYSSFQLNGQGRRIANDGASLAVEAKKGNQLVAFRINLETGQKGPDIPIPATDSAGNIYNKSVELSASARYIILGYGKGSVNYDAYDVNSTKLIHSYRGKLTLKHRDVYELDGRDYFVGSIAGSAPLLFGRRDILSDEFVAMDTRLGYGNHTSKRNYLDPRFAIVAFDGHSSVSKFTHEIVAISVNGTEKDVVRRLAHHNTIINSYSNEHHPNPSPDGKKIVFASNWGAVLGSDYNGPTSVYVILLPDWDTPVDTCHLFTPGMNVPATFGVPWNVFSDTTPLLISATCALSSATITLGTGSSLEYIYKQGYEYRNNAWHSITFTGSNEAGDWYIGSANTTVSELSENNLIVAYICVRNGTAWRCGCRDDTCAQSYWQLQAFRQ